MAKPTIILVPGGWHLPIHYKTLTDILASPPYSFPVQALKMPSVDSHPPQVSREPDVAVIRTAILDAIDSTESGDVWLLMHSYGGLCGSEAVEGLSMNGRIRQGLKGGISRLIYMAAFAGPEGVPIMQAKGYPGHAQWSVLNKDDSGNMSVPDPAPVFYQDCEEDVRNWAIGQLKSHSSGTMGAPIKHAPWAYVPSLYLLCEQDQGMVPAFQHSMIAQKEGWHSCENGWKVARLQSGHSPFLSMPGRVAEEVEAFWKTYSS